jgi:hypothetical protein
MDLLGLMRVKNEEDFIEEVLLAQSFCDKIVVLNNHSTDRTKEICQSFSNVDVIDTPFPEVSNWVNEGQEKGFLCEQAVQYNPQWICQMQGDEVLEPETYQKIRSALSDKTVECIDEYTLRVDGHFSASYRQSFWRFPAGNLTYDFCHCSLPQQLASVPKSRFNVALWHLGGLQASRRMNRANLYKSIDPDRKFSNYEIMIQGDDGGPDKNINITGEPFKLQSVDDFLDSVGNIYSKRVPKNYFGVKV